MRTGRRLRRGGPRAGHGSRNVFSAATIDQLPKHVSCGLMIGDAMALSVPDLDRTDHLLILGANPAVSNGSLCVALFAEDLTKVDIEVNEPAAAPTAAVYARIGTRRGELGTLTQWLVDVVNILTCDFDSRGGVMFARGALPVATLADEIETPGEGQVRALITIDGNPALPAPNGPLLAEALSGLDFQVCVDPYLNETLPVASPDCASRKGRGPGGDVTLMSCPLVGRRQKGELVS